MLVLGKFEEFTTSPELASKPALFCGRVNGLCEAPAHITGGTERWGVTTSACMWNVRWSRRPSLLKTEPFKVELLKNPENILYVKITERLLLLFWSSSLCVWLGGGRYSWRPGSGASVVLVPVDIVDNASLLVCVWRVPECTCCTPPAISLLFSNLQRAWWMRTQLIAHCQLPLIPPSKNPKLKTMVLT